MRKAIARLSEADDALVRVNMDEQVMFRKNKFYICDLHGSSSYKNLSAREIASRSPP